jgi:hypothetical protein
VPSWVSAPADSVNGLPLALDIEERSGPVTGPTDVIVGEVVSKFKRL